MQRITPTYNRGLGAMALALLITVAACGPTPSPTATPTPTAAISAPTVEATAAPTSTVSDPLPTPTTAVMPTAAATGEPTPTSDLGAATPAPTADLGALQWKQVGLERSRITDLAVAGGQNLDLVMAAGPGGAWVSKFGYTQWDLQSVSVAEDARTGEAEVGSADVLYFTSHTGCASGLPNNSWHSTDGGATWAQMRGEPMTIFAANATTAYATSCNGVRKTTDSGATWTRLEVPQSSSDPISIAASPDGQNVYVAFVSEGGTGQIWASSDGGAAWSEITPTNIPSGDGFHAPSHLTYVPGSVGRPDDGGLYLTTSQGIWHLPPESTTEWKLIKKTPIEGEGADPFSDWYTAFLVDTTYGTQVDKTGPILYVARARPGGDTAVSLGVWRSTDMGATWQRVGQGLENAPVNTLALALTDSTGTGGGMGPGLFETLLAGTDDGVWALQR